MKRSRVNLAIKLTWALSLPLVIAACGGTNNEGPSAPSGSVTATPSQVTPAIQAITLSNTTPTAATVNITPPSNPDFDMDTSAPAWCIGNTCPAPCPSLAFSLASGASCKVYIHADNTLAVGAIEADQIGITLNGKSQSYRLTNQGVLYAGGAFSSVDGAPVQFIAAWDGSHWHPLVGLPSATYSLKIGPNGALYDGTDASGVWAFTGQDWQRISNPHAIEQGMNGIVGSLAFDDAGHLYAGGEFTLADGISANRIAEWDGVNWTPVTNPSATTHGMGGENVNYVTSLVYKAGELYAGGYFSQADGKSVNNIAVWNGTDWSPVTTNPTDATYPFSGGVDSLIANTVDLYSGGDFAMADGQEVNHIAAWNNQTWQGVTNPNAHFHGVNVRVLAMAFDKEGDLYAGGNFTQADDNAAKYIAMWNGTNWAAVTNAQATNHGMIGGGNSPLVKALAYDPGSNILYAGGIFTQADDTAASYLAMWNGENWAPVTNSASTSHGFDKDVNALAIGNVLTIESNS